jgi:branched-chain amino acid transport system substrate-binding protein
MRRSSCTGLTAIALVAVTGLVAGCSSGGGSSPANSSAPAPATEAAPGTQAPATTAAPATTEAGKVATGEPIVIGFVNDEGGAFSVPELGVGNQVAQDYINNQLGGINGRPIEVKRCVADGSPEKSIDCANQLVEAGVVAVMEGTDLGADSMLPILKSAAIPMVGHVQFGPARMFDDNSYYFGAAALAYGASALQFYAGQGAKSVTWFFPDVDSSHAFTDSVLAPVAKGLGLEYKTVYYDPTAPNWSVLAATAASENPDVSGALAATDGQCAEMASALRGAGYQGKILAASCAGLHDAIGEQAVGVNTDADHWNPGDIASAPTSKQAELELYAKTMKAAGHEDLVKGNAVITFADLMNLSKIMSGISGDVTGATVAGALRATKDFDSFAGPKITCDHTVIPGNSACTTGLLFFAIQNDGSVKAVTNDFVDISAILAAGAG